jgi:two-component system, OmpR family, alkaline phosphatase synthesis response regulator PhoP
VSASILVADDEPNIVLSLEFLLSQAGFRVRTVADGEAALAAIAADPPDLVVLDVMIPGRDGYAVCQEIRANPAWRDMRILMLTAKGGDAQREKGISLGADEYVTKPFSTRELVDRVRRMLDRTRNRG